MGAYASVSVAKAGVNTANTVMWQLKTAAGERARITEVGIFITVAPTTAPQFVLARSTGLGTSTTSIAGTALDPADGASTVTLDTVWSAAPTFTTTGPFLRGMGLPVTAGSGIIWTFPDPLIVAVSSGLCIANAVASGATLGSMTCYVNWQE
jgi:hypothetical protein